jgi:hypothetical protein
MDARSTLRRVGAVLAAVGAIDIAFVVYCITNDVNYSSNFNEFAVVADLFLWFGHLGAVRFITAAAAFFFSGFLAVMVIFVPFGEPLALRPLRVVLAFVCRLSVARMET